MIKRLIICFLLVILLVLIRANEHLFYDPFLWYFYGEYQNHPFPEANNLKLFFSLLLRYTINTIISISILYTLFKNKDYIRFASILYLFFFIILIISFYLIYHFSDNTHAFILFYIRRFLAHPLLLLLFIPAFYIQNNSKQASIFTKKQEKSK